MPFNFPAPLPAKFQDGLSYPLNLTADNRNYFTRIRFIRYKPAFGESIGNIVRNIDDLLLSGVSAFASLYVPEEFTNPTGNLPFSGITNMGASIGNHISLPIPKKINEMNMMNWSEISLTGTILGAAASAASGGQRGNRAAAISIGTTALQIGSAVVGVQINPYILQYFQRPSFREFSFTWTLAPRNRKESEQINKIINQIKAAQAPRKAAGGLLMEYPDLAIVEFHPKDNFQIRLKECVIVGVNVDYTPAGPSYIGGTAAPTMVNLTIHLKETKLWWSEEWGGEVGTAAGNTTDDSSAPPTEQQPDGIDPLYGPGGLTG